MKKINHYFTVCLILLLGNLGFMQTSWAQVYSDGISITSVSPAQGSTVSGFINIAVETNALPENLPCMSINIKGYPGIYDCSPPFSISLDTRRYVLTTTSIGVTVVDILGNRSFTALNLNLANNGESLPDSAWPVSKIVKPARASQYFRKGDQLIAASRGFSFLPKNSKFIVEVAASDNSGSVQNVMFFYGHSSPSINTFEAAPYNLEIDSTKAGLVDPFGMLNLSVNASDMSGNSSIGEITYDGDGRHFIFTDDPAWLQMQADADAGLPTVLPPSQPMDYISYTAPTPISGDTSGSPSDGTTPTKIKGRGRNK